MSLNDLYILLVIGLLISLNLLFCVGVVFWLLGAVCQRLKGAR